MKPGIAAVAAAVGRWAGVPYEEALRGPWAWTLEMAWARAELEGRDCRPADRTARERLNNLMGRPWQASEQL